MRLAVPRARAEDVITRHLQDGQEMVDAASQVASEAEYEEWTNRRKRWRDLTQRALQTIFTTQEGARSFRTAASAGFVRMAAAGWHAYLGDEVGDLKDGLTKLESLRDQLEYIDEAETAKTPAIAKTTGPRPDAKVFLVHGRDNDLLTRVTHLLERTGTHEIVILGEQPSRGRTIIEKFEAHGSEADYAVVLLSGDDLGRLSPTHVAEGLPEPREQPRGRQNVIFEMGWFIGQLSRAHVTVLYEQGVELPSDYQGVIYTALDVGGQWRYELVKELRAAGFDFDANKIAG
jgi:predicted nucleotide-binding protein